MIDNEADKCRDNPAATCIITPTYERPASSADPGLVHTLAQSAGADLIVLLDAVAAETVKPLREMLPISIPDPDDAMEDEQITPDLWVTSERSKIRLMPAQPPGSRLYVLGGAQAAAAAAPTVTAQMSIVLCQGIAEDVMATLTESAGFSGFVLAMCAEYRSLRLRRARWQLRVPTGPTHGSAGHRRRGRHRSRA